MDPRPDVGEALRRGRGIVTVHSNQELKESLTWLCSRGELTRLLRGTYCATSVRDHPEIRMRAVMALHPDAVLTGAAAAHLSYWPETPLPKIEASVPRQVGASPGYLFSRRRIPPDLVVERDGWRFTAPELTALDLASFDNTDPIDIALRTRAATLPRMHEALRLTPGRDGNQERTRLLLDSRDNPWSAAERRAQRLLREAGIDGWEGNLSIMLRGQERFLDVGFKRLKLCLEIDGRIHQLDPALFESDRARQNALVLDGWMVLRFTWLMIENEPDALIAMVREAIQLRRSRR